jgi:hypothetical protein
MSTSNNTTHAEQHVDARLSPFEEPAEVPVQNELQNTPKREREDDAEATRPAEHVPASPSKKSSKKCASKSLSVDDLAKAVLADINDAKHRFERQEKKTERQEKKLADIEAAMEKKLADIQAAMEKKLADIQAAMEKSLTEIQAAMEKKLAADMQAASQRIERQQARKEKESALLLSTLKKGVQCSAQRGRFSNQMANCTIIKVHKSENKDETEYTILFDDSTQPVKFPLKRMSLHRMPLQKEDITAYYHDSKKACKALLAQIDDAAEDNAEVTEEA